VLAEVLYVSLVWICDYLLSDMLALFEDARIDGLPHINSDLQIKRIEVADL
jgi:hypothetical protein